MEALLALNRVKLPQLSVPTAATHQVAQLRDQARVVVTIAKQQPVSWHPTTSRIFYFYFWP